MAAYLVYVTASSDEEAEMIARTLVGERLAACANLLGAIRSIYWWEGTLQEDGEVALVLKTRGELVDRVVARVKEVHSYDCPCVIALPVSAGNPEFLNWIESETE